MKRKYIAALVGVLTALAFLFTGGQNLPGNEPMVTEPKAHAAEMEAKKDEMTLYITAGGRKLTATLVDNSSARALVEYLKQGPVTIDMHDFGNFEKTGELGTTLPRNDEEFTTVPGDLILYQGRIFVIYYDTNTWDFTRLGKINGVDQTELKSILGSGNVSVTISLD